MGLGIKIYNLEDRLLIYNEEDKSMEYVLKEGLTVGASNGSVVLNQNGSAILTANPEKITLPTENALFDLVQIIDGYLISNPSGVFSGGWADYNDNATSGTPLNVTGGGAAVLLTNDALGSFTNTEFLPFGVSKLWDSSTDKFDFSELSLGDTVDIRMDITVTTASNNTAIDVDLSLGAGGSAYTIPFVSEHDFKTTAAHKIVEFNSVYIGDSNTKDNGGQLLLSADKNCTVVVNGWYIRAIKIGSI